MSDSEEDNVISNEQNKPTKKRKKIKEDVEDNGQPEEENQKEKEIKLNFFEDDIDADIIEMCNRQTEETEHEDPEERKIEEEEEKEKEKEEESLLNDDDIGDAEPVDSIGLEETALEDERPMTREEKMAENRQLMIEGEGFITEEEEEGSHEYEEEPPSHKFQSKSRNEQAEERLKKPPFLSTLLNMNDDDLYAVGNEEEEEEVDDDDEEEEEKKEEEDEATARRKLEEAMEEDAGLNMDYSSRSLDVFERMENEMMPSRRDTELFDPDGLMLTKYIKLLMDLPIDDLKTKHANAALSCLHRKWMKLPHQDIMTFAHLRYKMNVNHDATRVNSMLPLLYKHFQTEAIAIHRLFGRFRSHSFHIHNWETIEKTLNWVYTMIHETFNLLWFEHRIYMLQYDFRMDQHPVFNPYSFRQVTSKSFKGTGRFIFRILHEMERMNVRRDGGCIYIEQMVSVVDDQGIPRTYGSGFWQNCGSTHQWITRNFNSIKTPEMLQEAVAYSKIASEYINTCYSHQVMHAVRDRRAFSFADGRWFMDCDGLYFDQFIKYEDCKNLEHIVSAKFFPHNFGSYNQVGLHYDYKDNTYFFENGTKLTDAEIAVDPSKKPLPSYLWSDKGGIDTMPFDKIVLESQRFDESEYKLLLAGIGSCFYAVRSVHRWEKMLFIIGYPRTGKTTLVKFLFDTYLPCDVGIFSNTVEETFGLHQAWGKFLCGCSEVKSTFGLPEAELQSMVTGEYMSLAVKHKDPLQVIWDTPVILAGNQFPNWENTGGAIGRRLLPFMFDKPIGDQNVYTRLDEDMEKYRGAIMRKALWALHSKLIQLGDSPIDSLITKRMRETIERISNSRDSFRMFLHSGAFAYFIARENAGKSTDQCTTYMPKEVFIAHLKFYCERFNLRFPSNLNTIEIQYQLSGLLVFERSETNKTYNGRMLSGHHQFYIGIDFIERRGKSCEQLPGSYPDVIEDAIMKSRKPSNRTNTQDESSYQMNNSSMMSSTSSSSTTSSARPTAKKPLPRASNENTSSSSSSSSSSSANIENEYANFISV